MTFLLGIDVGTGGAKALLVDGDGSVIAAVTTPYELHTPRPQWAEQDPADWCRATIASVRGVLEQAGVAGGDVAAVGLTGQMHGLVLLDGAGEVIRPAILWNDQRTASQCAELQDRVGVETLMRIAGKPALTGFTAPKILWVREHEPEAAARASMMLLPKDYVRYRMTGEFVTDVADASGTLLFDVGRRCWSETLMAAAGVERGQLPDVVESPEICGAVSASFARDTGLAEGTPVVGGGGDQAAEAIGCGIVEEGQVSVTMGTSGVVFAAMPEYRIDETGGMHAYCHAVPGWWHVMGVMLSAGGSLRWYRDTLGDGADYDTLIVAAAAVPAGCEGLLFLPYLTGERTPHADPEARGAFIGLTLRHGRPHLTRAVMEGVTFGLLDALELTRGLGVEVKRVRISGGGARSAVWRQMLADVFDAEVVTVNATQGAAFGAALLAGVGAGVYEDVVTAGRSVVRETGVTTPGADREAYAKLYGVYRACYPALKQSFTALSAMARG